MNACEIKGFPLPPSANALYANSDRGRFKTAAYKSFEQTVHYWALKNQHILNVVREMTLDIGPGEALRVDRIYHFRPHKIITKDKKPRRNDTSNRIKCLDDVLGLLLGIDDSYFWEGSYTKRPITVEGLEEGVDVRFSIVSMTESYISDFDAV